MSPPGITSANPNLTRLLDRRSIAAHLRLRGAQARAEGQATVARITGELAGLARRTCTEAQAVLRNARRALPRVTGRAAGRLRRAVTELAVMINAPTP